MVQFQPLDYAYQILVRTTESNLKFGITNMPIRKKVGVCKTGYPNTGHPDTLLRPEIPMLLVGLRFCNNFWHI